MSKKQGTRPRMTKRSPGVRILTDEEAAERRAPVTVESAAAAARNAPNLPGFPVFGPSLAALGSGASREEILRAEVLDSLAVVEHHALETLRKEAPALAMNHRDTEERCRFYERLAEAGVKREAPAGYDPALVAKALPERMDASVGLRRAQAALGVLDATGDARAAFEAGNLLLALARVSGLLAHSHVADVVTGFWRRAVSPHTRRPADEAVKLDGAIRRRAAELVRSGMKKRDVDALLAAEYGISERTARTVRTGRPSRR